LAPATLRDQDPRNFFHHSWKYLYWSSRLRRWLCHFLPVRDRRVEQRGSRCWSSI